MPTIADQISRLQGAKADIKTAIEGKGVSVPSSALLDSYPDYIDAIQQGGGEHTYTGHVDTAGLTALGWDADDIQWLQDHVWWDAEDDAYWAVSEANLAFGPNGATPLTWNTRAQIQFNPEVRYFPKFSAPTGQNIQILFNGYVFLVAIPTHGWDMSDKTGMQQIFNNCACLRSVGNISQWDVHNVTNMRGMFGGCSSLREIDISGWDTSSVQTFKDMFGYCVSLESIDLTNLDLTSATTIQSMFTYCVNLKEIKGFANKTAPALTSMAGFAYYCYSLKNLTIDNLNAPLLTTIQNIAAYGCLESAELGIVGSAINEIRMMFTACRNLRSIDMRSIDLTSCAQAGVGTADYQAPFNQCAAVTIRLGSKFFSGSFTTFWATSAYAWSRDSIYESLYTNQTLRDTSSTAVTVRLAAAAYDRLSQQDRDDIATKNITLMRN